MYGLYNQLVYLMYKYSKNTFPIFLQDTFAVLVNITIFTALRSTAVADLGLLRLRVF